MPYIGKNPVGGGFHKLDSLTASATDTYALTLGSAAYYPESANQLLVSLNGVIQAPQDSFTVSGSNLVFDTALTASDSIDFVVALGDVLAVQTVTDGAITSNKIGTDAVTTAKIQDGAVTKAKMGTTELDLATIKDSTGTNTAMTIDSSGFVKAKTCAFRMHQSTAQSLSHATNTTLTFDTSDIDTASIIDLTNNKVVITAATAGLWYLDFTFCMTNTIAFRQTAFIYVNGTAIARHEPPAYSQTTGAYPSANVHTLHELSSGDEITFTGYHAYGSARSTYADAGLSTVAQGYRIGD